MFGPGEQLDREIDSIIEDENNGAISHEEATRLINQLQRDYREEMREAMWEAAERERENW